jgi:hypothetical protein
MSSHSEKQIDGQTWRRMLVKNGTIIPAELVPPPPPFDWSEHGHAVLKLRGDEATRKGWDIGRVETRQWRDGAREP